MTCFCSRRILDFVEDADSKGFRGFMSQVNKQMKLAQAFQKSAALQHVMSKCESLACLIDGLAASRHDALTSALEQARDNLGFCRSASEQGSRRHGLLLVQDLERAKALAPACEQALDGSGAQIL